MKSAIMITMVMAMLLGTSGCMSPGGLVVGPISGYTSGQNERAVIRRSAAMSKLLSADQKKKVFTASTSMSGAEEISVMVGVDLLQLRGAKLTSAEVGKQVLGVLGDAILYGLVAYGADEAGLFGGNSSGGDTSTSEDINIDVTGSDNTTIVIDGDTTTDDSNVQN
jgi:hypothetical protein